MSALQVYQQVRSMNGKIREMRKRDYPMVEKLLQQLNEVHIEGRPELFVAQKQVYTRDFFESMISNEEMITILAEINHAVVGICVVSLMNTSGMVKMKTAYVDELVVDKPYRRRGIGRALFAEASKRAKKMGAQRIDLMVWSFNKNAISAYDAYGMVPQRCIYEKEL